MPNKKLTAQQLADHVASICKSFCIEVAYYSGAGRACRSNRWIRIRPVRSVVSYAVALHEIGHIVGRGHRGARIEKEVAAWEWALENALPGTKGKRFRATVANSLRSYLRWAQRCQHRKFAPKIPSVGHRFWKLAQVEVYGEKKDAGS